MLSMPIPVTGKEILAILKNDSIKITGLKYCGK